MQYSNRKDIHIHIFLRDGCKGRYNRIKYTCNKYSYVDQQKISKVRNLYILKNTLWDYVEAIFVPIMKSQPNVVHFYRNQS